MTMPTWDVVLFVVFGAGMHLAFSVVAVMTVIRLIRRQPVRPWQIICSILAALVWVDLLKALYDGNWHRLFS